MPKKPKQKKKIEEITNGLSKKCQISTTPEAATSNQPPKYIPSGKTILAEQIDPTLLAKWPKLKFKVPPIFIHIPTEFEQHVKKIITLGVKFYKPRLTRNSIRIICPTFNDHQHLTKYLDKKQLLYHTYGNPSKRKMKVVIRALPNDMDLNIVKEELKSVSIPVIRVHKMQNKSRLSRKDNTMLVLGVVPYDDDGKQILKVKQLLGHEVELEPPKMKPRQCHRCQRWGHSQRYCHGQIRCVKCAEEHSSKKCEKPLNVEPKCANCGEGHTASYRKCKFTFDSDDFQMMQVLNLLVPCYNRHEIVTLDNYKTMYRNVDYTKTSKKN